MIRTFKTNDDKLGSLRKEVEHNKQEIELHKKQIQLLENKVHVLTEKLEEYLAVRRCNINAAKTLLWYGLAPDGYSTAIRSYEFFCTSRGIPAWPATTINLIEWVNTRAFGSAIPNKARFSRIQSQDIFQDYAQIT